MTTAQQRALATFQHRGPFLESPEKPLIKLRPTYSVKLVFLYVVKGIKIKITAKFRACRRLRFEDTKRITSPEKFGDFRETGPWSAGSASPQTKQLSSVELGELL